MATVKISDLPAATVPLDGTELVPIVQSSTTDRVSVANLTAGRTVNASALAATGTVSGATVTATGTVSGATVTATGTVSGATVTATGTVSGATVSGTTVSGTTVSGTTITATGTVSGATVTATGTVSGAAVTATGVVSGATVSGTTVNIGLGTVSAPSIAPTGDSNTGIYFPGADRIAFTEGGVQAGEFDASGNFLFNSGYGSVARAFGCRAWVNFNGEGTVAIRASGNVSSITDGGTGNYTVNFTTAMPDINYSVVLGGSRLGGAGFSTATSFLTTSTGLLTYNTSAASADWDIVCVSVFR